MSGWNWTMVAKGPATSVPSGSGICHAGGRDSGLPGSPAIV